MSGATRRALMAHIVPNLLTFLRFGLAAAFPFASPEGRVALIVAAGLSDAFDGAFSRLFHSSSTFGQILDPIADKTFVGVLLGTLLAEGALGIPALLFVAARDLAVIAGCAVAVARAGWSALRWMPPHLLGKAATGLQFLFLLVVVYIQEPPRALLLVTGAVSVAAGVDYLRYPHWKAIDAKGHPGSETDATAQLQHPQGDRRA